MKTSIDGINLIKRFEGFSEKLYFCPAGKPTIGYGHVVLRSENASLSCKKLTEEDAVKLLAGDLITREIAVEKMLKTKVSQHQFDALVSFAYNVGENNLAASTLLKKVNANDFQGASQEFLRWNKSTINGVLTELKGLTTRRQAERDLFLAPDKKEDK